MQRKNANPHAEIGFRAVIAA